MRIQYSQVFIQQLKPGFHLDFVAFCCSFWFFVLTKSHNEQCNAEMETSTKNQNEQQKAIKSNKRHLPVLVFGVELILSQKQVKSNEEQQKATNGKWKHAPKTKTSGKNQQRTFLIPIFIHSHQFWSYGRWLVSRAMKSQKEQRWATKSNKKQQKATKSNKTQQRTSKLEKPKRARKNKTSNERHEKSKWKLGLRLILQ